VTAKFNGLNAKCRPHGYVPDGPTTAICIDDLKRIFLLNWLLNQFVHYIFWQQNNRISGKQASWWAV